MTLKSASHCGVDRQEKLADEFEELSAMRSHSIRMAKSTNIIFVLEEENPYTTVEGMILFMAKTIKFLHEIQLPLIFVLQLLINFITLNIICLYHIVMQIFTIIFSMISLF